MPFELVEPGILTVGVDASAPGALHSDPSVPGFEGFEVDLMTEVAVRLGLTYRYRGGPGAGLIDELREGRLDAVVTAATITEERKRLVDFSEPYLEYRLGIAVGRHGAIRTLADLDGKRIAVRIATTAAQFAQTRAKAAEIRSYHTNVEAFEAVRAGVVDAWVEDAPIAQWFVDRIPELELAGTIEATRRTTRSCSAKATMQSGRRSIRCWRRSKPMAPTIGSASGGSAGASDERSPPGVMSSYPSGQSPSLASSASSMASDHSQPRRDWRGRRTSGLRSGAAALCRNCADIEVARMTAAGGRSILATTLPAAAAIFVFGTLYDAGARLVLGVPLTIASFEPRGVPGVSADGWLRLLRERCRAATIGPTTNYRPHAGVVQRCLALVK